MVDIKWTLIQRRSRTNRIKAKHKVKKFIGFDTETYKGACKLLAASDNKHIYNPTFFECLDFLTAERYRDKNLMFWNIDFDLGAILKLCKIKELWDYITRALKVKFGKYTIQYFRPSFLIIWNNGNRFTFTDGFRFFQQSLDLASERYLNKHKRKDIDASRLNDSLGYWRKHLKMIISYCKKDCRLVAELMTKMQEYLNNELELTPQYYVSCASLSKTYFRKNCYIPSIKHIPNQALRAAYLTYRGGRFEILKRGYFPYLVEYDINSAYPKAISELFSGKKGKWNRVKEFKDKAFYGFYKVIVKENNNILSRVPYKQDNTILVFPKGIFEIWLTQQELELFEPNEFKVNIGYVYYPNPNDWKPFEKEVIKVYSNRKTFNQNEMMYYILKITLNSLYGTFIERNKIYSWLYRTGALFNPVYASYITARVRVQLYNLAKKYEKNVAAMHTDSIMFNKRIAIKQSDKLGEWKKEEEGEGIIVNTGVYQIGNIHKQRGFSRKQFNVFNLLKENPEKTHIPYPERHFVRLRESIMRKNYIDKLNTIVEMIKELDINADSKRVWSYNWKNAAELLKKNMNSYTLELRSRFRRLGNIF